MSRAETEKVVRDVYAARLRNDLEMVRDYFSPESRFAINGSPEASAIAMHVSGKPTIDRVLADLVKSWEWLEQDIERLLVDGDRAAIHYRLKVRFTPTNEVIETTICDLLTVQSGKLVEVIQFIDTALAGRLVAQVRSAA